ncbi:hypothetical protein ACN38_g2009 [Penicillium nordicum]|uniref:Uncharacterized protein n=1 Tax=Penicillium nordicum TaxID=229535 RepID=A0A0M8PAN8_9EURO|nr:hypothetical protein ACN38_g2009 [Penicillium nordicum]
MYGVRSTSTTYRGYRVDPRIVCNGNSPCIVRIPATVPLDASGWANSCASWYTPLFFLLSFFLSVNQGLRTLIYNKHRSPLRLRPPHPIPVRYSAVDCMRHFPGSPIPPT